MAGSGRLALALLAARPLQKLARLASVGTSNSKLVLLLLDSLSLLTSLQKGLVTLSEAKSLYIIVGMLRCAQHDKNEFFKWIFSLYTYNRSQTR
jgi:hypothetical protein